MKTQKFKILSLRMALLTILLSGLSMQNIYAFSETTKNLPLNGRWEVKQAKASLHIPPLPVTIPNPSVVLLESQTMVNNIQCKMANNQGNYLTGVFGI